MKRHVQLHRPALTKRLLTNFVVDTFQIDKYMNFEAWVVHAATKMETSMHLRDMMKYTSKIEKPPATEHGIALYLKSRNGGGATVRDCARYFGFGNSPGKYEEFIDLANSAIELGLIRFEAEKMQAKRGRRRKMLYAL